MEKSEGTNGGLFEREKEGEGAYCGKKGWLFIAVKEWSPLLRLWLSLGFVCLNFLN